MKKVNFQRLVATIIILLVVFIDIPSVFKDFLIILLSFAFFISTFNVIKKKKIEENVL